MHFLFPNVLWGLLALSIPLIVHLFNFRRTKKVFFSNVSLLKAVETQTSAFRKLKRWLIMATRMLFLACIVLAFAQPVKSLDGNSKSLQNIGINGIYLDNSLSMQNTTESKRFIDLAIIKIDELLSIFNKSSNLQISTNDFDGQDQYVMNAAKIKDRLTTIDFSESPRTLEQIYKRQHSIAQKNNSLAQNNLFWFSDFQKSTAGKLQDLKIDTKDIIHLIPVVGKKSQNVFVDSLWLGLPLVREMQNNALYVKVYNSGNGNVDNLPLKLYIDGIQASTSSVNIAKNSSSVAVFNFTVKGKGTHKAKIIFDDQPITFDNEYFFILNASPTIRVLHLFGQRSPQNYIAKMYANDSVFNFTSYSTGNVDPSVVQNADFVVLEGVNTIEGELKLSLETFIKAGGSVFISPSDNPSGPSFQNFLSQFGIQKVTAVNDMPSPQKMIEINEPEKSSPFFEDVFEKGAFSGVVSLPKAQSNLKWSGIVDKLLTYKNGQNFLTKTKVGDGFIYVLAAPLNSQFSNFAEHAFFVPTFYKMAYLSSKADRLAYSFRESTLRFFMPNAPKNATYKLKSDKLELIPIQKLIGKTLFLELPKSSDLNADQVYSSGFFNLTINGKAEKTIAINHDNKESRLEVYDATELKEIFKSQKNIKIYDNMLDGGFIDAFKDTSVSKTYWKYFIVAALMFLLTEILLVRFMKA
jgi:hypothetical protein